MIHLIKTSARLLKQQQSLTLVAPSPYSLLSCCLYPPFLAPTSFQRKPRITQREDNSPFLSFLSSSSLFNFRTFTRIARSDISTMTSSSSSRSPRPRQRSTTILAVSLVFASYFSLSTALPGRFPCGTTSANQHICDNLSTSISPKTIGLPVGSQCVEETKQGGFYCGWAGAK